VPGQLLSAIKEAAPLIGISPRLVHAVEWLFRFTQPQDWQDNARPIVWPSGTNAAGRSTMGGVAADADIS
jgi:replication initiation protein RepC